CFWVWLVGHAPLPGTGRSDSARAPRLPAHCCPGAPGGVGLVAHSTGGRPEGSSVAADSRQIIAGGSGSLRSPGALRAAVAEARAAGTALVAVLAWAPAGGEIAYLRAPCPLLLRLWEQEACERLRDAFDQALGGMPGGVAVRQLVVRASPGPALVELAC